MVKKIRVAFCESGYQRFYGAQQSLYNLIINLDVNSIIPVVVTPGEGLFTKRIDDASVVRRMVSYPGAFDRPGEDIRKFSLIKKGFLLFDFIAYLVKNIKHFSKEKYDVVYCNDIRSVLTAGLAARLCFIPVVWYVRTDKRLGVFNWIGAIIAKRVITIADSVKEIFPRKIIPGFGKKFTTIYTGIDLSGSKMSDTDGITLRDELNVPEDATFIAVIASIRPQKGQKEFVLAMKKVLEKQSYGDLKCLLIGDVHASEHDDYLEEIKKEIQGSNLQDYFLFLGWRDDILKILCQIDILVLPSYNEGLPRIVLEAMACGCPVIATDAGGTGELVVDGQTGFVVQQGDVEALAERIGYMLSDCELRRSMGRESKGVVEKHFTLEGYVRAVEEVLCACNGR